MDNRHQPKLQDLLTSVKFVSESIGRDFNNNNPFDDGPTSTTHSPKREDEPLTSTQQMILYAFFGALAAFIIFGLLRAVLLRIMYGPKGGPDPPPDDEEEAADWPVPSQTVYEIEVERQRIAEDRPVYNSSQPPSRARTTRRNHNSVAVISSPTSYRLQEPTAPFTEPSPFAPAPRIQDDSGLPTYDQVFPDAGQKNTAGWVFPPTKLSET